jgi:hypothetical protein
MLSHQRPSLLPLLLCVIGAACAGSPKNNGSTDTGGAGEEETGGSTGSTGGKTGSTGGKTGSTGGSGGSTPGTGGATGGTGDGGSPGTGGSGSGESDAGTAGDAAAPAGDGGGMNPLPPGMKVVYLLHETMPGGSANDPSRKSLLDILNSMKESHGVVVKMVDSATPAAMMPDAALIFIGPNASMFEKHPAPDLKNSPVPLIISKDGNTTEIGLGNVVNTPAVHDTIKIINADHPLAAGLPLGNVKVNTSANAQRMCRVQNVGPDAIKIAVSLVDNTSYSVVGYEKGGTMANGFKAPAKRVALFWHRPAAATPEGAKLVKAAVDWALRP